MDHEEEDAAQNEEAPQSRIVYVSPRQTSSHAFFYMKNHLPGLIRDDAAQLANSSASAFSAASSSSSSSSSTGVDAASRFSHPLDRFGDEIALWVYDERQGALIDEAREQFQLPPDSFTRAAWRRLMAVETLVESISVKEKRQLYLWMRSISEEARQMGGDAVDSEWLVPDLGLTVGQLAVFHILLTRTSYAKESSLQNLVEACDLVNPSRQQARIEIDMVPDSALDRPAAESEAGPHPTKRSRSARRPAPAFGAASPSPCGRQAAAGCAQTR